MLPGIFIVFQDAGVAARNTGSEGAAMSRIIATFSVLSGKLHPDQTTSILSFVPDHSVLNGTDRNPPRPVPEAFGWYVTVAPVGGGTVDDALSLLLARLRPIHTQFPKLCESDPDVQVKFHVSVTPYSEDVSLYFRAASITAVAKFGVASTSSSSLRKQPS